MNDDDNMFGYWVLTALLILLGLVGVVVATQAADTAMLVFGLVLAGFAVFFTFFAIHRAYRQSDQP